MKILFVCALAASCAAASANDDQETYFAGLLAFLKEVEGR
jgi:hypothetical protein